MSVEKPAARRCPPPPSARAIAETSTRSSVARSDTLRRVAALVRDLLSDEGRRKVSLRATNGLVDVSAIARGFGGGGHRQAAGFTTDVPIAELVERLRTEVEAQL